MVVWRGVCGLALTACAAKSNGMQSTSSLEAVVLGRRPRRTTFSSSSPSIPFLILRDPPGDASYAYVEEGQTVCESWSFSASDAKDTEGDVTLSLGPDIEFEVGFGFSVSTSIDVTADIGSLRVPQSQKLPLSVAVEPLPTQITPNAVNAVFCVLDALNVPPLNIIDELVIVTLSPTRPVPPSPNTPDVSYVTT